MELSSVFYKYVKIMHIKGEGTMDKKKRCELKEQLTIDYHEKTDKYEEWFLFEHHAGTIKEISISIQLQADNTLLLYGDISAWGEWGYLEQEAIFQLLEILLLSSDFQTIQNMPFQLDEEMGE